MLWLKKQKYSGNIFYRHVSLLVTLLLAGKHALGGRGKLLGKYIWLRFELLILQGTCALWLSHIRFPENRFTSRASKAGCRTWYKTKSSALFGSLLFWLNNTKNFISTCLQISQHCTSPMAAVGGTSLTELIPSKLGLCKELCGFRILTSEPRLGHVSERKNLMWFSEESYYDVSSCIVGKGDHQNH